MQITSCKMFNKKYIQIYLKEEELDTKKINNIIQKYEKEKCSVAIFVTGKENYPEILKKIIMKQAK